MFKNITQRLTYRNVLYWMGFLIALAFGLMWLIHLIQTKQAIFDSIAFLIPILGGLIVLALTTLFPRLVSDEPIFGAKDKPSSEQNRRKNRDAILDAVEQIWITGFLDNVLNQMASLNLKLDFLEPDKVAKREGWEDYTLTTTRAIHQHFNHLNRRMVILGVPGAGKTVLLLQLCRELIAEAKADERRPVPVVLVLSSWAAAENSQQPFEDWLKQELCEIYDLKRKIVADLVESEQLLYLLDGLDEVSAEKRDECLQAIKTFVETERPGLPYVLCSRKEEFEELIIRPDVDGEIVIQALRPEQIQEYLRGTEFIGLRTLISENTIVREHFVPVPFMLNTLAVVTRGKNADQLRREISTFIRDEVRLRDYFLENYINYRLQIYFLQFNHSKSDLYRYATNHYKDHKQTRRWLKWLSENLFRYNQVDFYQERLQPEWLTEIQLRRYARRVRLIFGLVFGVSTGLSFGLTILQEFDSAVGLAVGIILGLLVGPAFGLILGIATGLGFRFFAQEMITYPSNNMIGKYLIINIFRSYLIVILITWLVGKMFSWFAIRPTINLDTGIGIEISWEIVIGITLGLTGGLLVGFIIGLIIGLLNYNIPIIQYVVLRSILAQDGYIPRWRYDLFLDYAAELVILRKVGGGYRFVHDYLRQYLASAAFVPDAYHVANDESGESR